MSVLQSLEDALLVGRAARGDHHAFERLYRRHIGRVYAICLRMVADQTRAEELAQEAFVRAWEKLATFRGAAAFSSWMYRLTVNVIVESGRSLGRIRFHESARVDAGTDSEGVASDSIEAYSTHDPDTADRLDIERAIASLPDGARTVFVLHDVEGYEHHEIAELAGVSVGTSKAQLHRARRLLRLRLER
ncbi:sigma-70 family RNA polymerase sigma factor [Candidatus Fermentibacteria bacterium]|nr:sigma-70 family RNA polymerase sigma factor [Candidatus Fermentibacteria bacterium]